MVRVDIPEPTTEDGLKFTLVFCGNPLTLKFAVAENPPWAVIVTLYCVLEPRFTVAAVGTTEIEKSGRVLTIRVTAAVCIRVPLVAVMVSG